MMVPVLDKTLSDGALVAAIAIISLANLRSIVMNCTFAR